MSGQVNIPVIAREIIEEALKRAKGLRDGDRLSVRDARIDVTQLDQKQLMQFVRVMSAQAERGDVTVGYQSSHNITHHFIRR